MVMEPSTPDLVLNSGSKRMKDVQLIQPLWEKSRPGTPGGQVCCQVAFRVYNRSSPCWALEQWLSGPEGRPEWGKNASAVSDLTTFPSPVHGFPFRGLSQFFYTLAINDSSLSSRTSLHTCMNSVLEYSHGQKTKLQRIVRTCLILAVNSIRLWKQMNF